MKHIIVAFILFLQGEMFKVILYFIIFLQFLCIPVKCDEDSSSGMDFGDAMALIIGLTVTTLGILACLGKYARTVAAGQY